MAYIDRIYLKTYKAYTEFLQWCKDANIKYRALFDEHGVDNIIHWIREYTEETFNCILESNGEVYIATTPQFIDAMIIRYCPIEAVQKQMQKMYATDYKAIKDGTDNVWAPIPECRCKKVIVRYPNNTMRRIQRPHRRDTKFILDDCFGYENSSPQTLTFSFFCECTDRKWRPRNRFCGDFSTDIEYFGSIKAAVRYIRKNAPAGVRFCLRDISSNMDIFLETK